MAYSRQNHEKGKGPNRRVCKMENKDDKKEDNKNTYNNSNKAIV
jgi:hypothetical protein